MIVNFGAMTAFIVVNAAVIALFVFKRKSRRWLYHVISPILGISMLVAVLTQMRKLGLIVGFGWMIVGVIVYWFTWRRRRMTPGLAATPYGEQPPDIQP
jgi:amino acid transporter